MRRHRERADVDLLTGLLTRRAFLEQVSLRISESRRKRREFALCIIDLDRFKEVNDVHGHLVGDKVLAQLGRLLKNRFRHEDLRCRWGGEEFAILLVDEGAVTARQVVHRVLEEFREITFQGDTGEEFHSTFSGGIAEFDTDSDQFEGLMRVADERLYQAKLAGRNRIAI
jgi:diguanylate cyclase (GGDEF)-like protein